ncbi:MAG: arginase family protein, partial [Flavobacteriales bacterium]|nr:arginase family protein [Flavobacteriales bacterium]
TSDGFLNKIILHQPNYLFNFSNIGLQTYFENPDQILLMNKMFFDVYRLGEINKTNLPETEPIVRNADVVSFDVSAIRKSDAVGTSANSPNGFYGEEACQIVKYAGMSDKLSSIGFYEYNPRYDINNNTAMLIAQMVWCCIDGYYSRKKEFPISNKSEFLKFRVVLEDQSHEIVFYKSQKSDRWWMDVPYPMSKSVKYERHHLVPCSYKDYQQACDEDMPEKWWKTYQKLN